MWFPLIVVIAQLSAAPAPVQKAYQKLTQTDLDAKKTSTRPPASAKKIDVTEKVKSASLGHKTFLLVSDDGREFGVEFGRSTNMPAQLHGPFPVEEPEPTTPPPSTPKPAPKGPANAAVEVAAFRRAVQADDPYGGVHVENKCLPQSFAPAELVASSVCSTKHRWTPGLPS